MESIIAERHKYGTGQNHEAPKSLRTNCSRCRKPRCCQLRLLNNRSESHILSVHDRFASQRDYRLSAHCLRLGPMVGNAVQECDRVPIDLPEPELHSERAPIPELDAPLWTDDGRANIEINCKKLIHGRTSGDTDLRRL